MHSNKSILYKVRRTDIATSTHMNNWCCNIDSIHFGHFISPRIFRPRGEDKCLLVTKNDNFSITANISTLLPEINRS